MFVRSSGVAVKKSLFRKLERVDVLPFPTLFRGYLFPTNWWNLERVWYDDEFDECVQMYFVLHDYFADFI